MTLSSTFSATVSVGTSMKCWCTIPIPRSIASRVESHGTSSPSISMVPGVGGHGAEDDVHQRALAGSVLAQKSVDLAREELDLDVVVGQQVAEGLGHAGQPQGGDGHIRPRLYRLRRVLGLTAMVPAASYLLFPVTGRACRR